MGDIRIRRFHWLKPGTIYTFSVQAISGGAQSDPATIDIKTSGFQGMTWPSYAKIKARPAYWMRTIVVKWTTMNEPLRMDYYRLFRKAGSAPTPTEKANYNTTSPHFLKDTGRWAYHTDHLTGTSKGLKDWGNEIEADITYYYWVWAFDKSGRASATALGPNSARYGDPEKPIILGEGTTQVHERNKWWCDYKLQWVCSGGCEYYIVQRKLSNLSIWGPQFMVEHNSEQETQEHTFDNLLCGKEYDFRIKAVNVPIVFVSDWSDVKSYTTEEDTTPPVEIQNVAARRFYHVRKQYGDYIKLTWDRPENAIIEQQLDYYRIYRLKGTDTQAKAYRDSINSSSQADDASKPDPYADSKKFNGTQFIDDDLEATLDTGSGGELLWNTLWDMEGATDVLRRTMEIGEDTVVGTLTGSPTFTSPGIYGDYAFCIPSSAAIHQIYFDTTGKDIIDPNLGYMAFYVKMNWTNVTGPNAIEMFRLEASSTRFFNLVLNGAVFLMFQRIYSSNTVYVYWDKADLTPYDDQWLLIEFQWSQLNWIRGRLNGGAWKYNPFNTPTIWNTGSYPIKSNYFGKRQAYSMPEFWLDNIALHNDLTVPVSDTTEYYHYWVTGVDFTGLESSVTGPDDDPNESYDKVSFSPPPPPDNVTVDFNTTLNLLSVKLMTAKISWDAVDEATHFRVAVRTKPKGRTAWSKWFHSFYFREERIDDPDGGGKFYVWPFPVLQGTEFNYAVCSYNAAGESAYVEKYTTVTEDTIKPSEIQNVWGRCFGMRSLLGQKMWICAKLTWDDLPAYEGIRVYKVYRWVPLTSSWDWVTNAHPTIGELKVHAYDLCPPIANSHLYKIEAIDWNDNVTDYPVEYTIDWLQWFKIASH